MAKLTQVQQNKATNARLVRTYNITLEEYDRMLKEQGGVCKICKKPPGSRRHHVDHDHKVPRLKITTTKVAPGKWFAECESLHCTAPTKSQALQGVKRQLLRASIRSLLCFPCNRGLRTWNDNPTNLRNAAQYLEEFQCRLTKTLHAS